MNLWITKLNLILNDVFLTSAFIFCSVIVSAQTPPKQFHFSEYTATQIVEELQQSYGIKFNYNLQVLPKKNFTFSASGRQDEVLKTVFSVLDRDFKVLEKNLFVIKPTSINPENKVQPQKIVLSIKNEFGEALPYCNIWHQSLKKGWESNAYGKLEIHGYFAKSDLLKITFLGYKDGEVLIQDLLENPEIKLTQESYTLGEIVVSDFAHKIAAISNQVSIDPNAFQKSGTAERDMLQIAQFIPGINNATESLNDIQIRGGPPDQTSIKWNGIKVFQNSLFYGKVSSVNPFLVNKMTISKNGVATQRPGTAAGEISMENIQNQEDSLQIRIHSNLLNTNLGLSTPLFNNKAQVNFAYRRSYTDFFQNWVFEKYFDQSFQEGRIEDDKFYRDLWDLDQWYTYPSLFDYSDLGGSFHFSPTDKDYFKISYMQMGNKLTYGQDETDIQAVAEENLRLKNRGFSALYERKWSNDQKTKLSFSHSNYNYDYIFESFIPLDYQEELFTIENKVDLDEVILSHQYTKEAVTLEFGGELSLWNLNYITTEEDDNQFKYLDSIKVKANEPRLFANITWKPSEKFALSSGIKYSFYSLGREKFIEPGLHISYRPASWIELHASYGRYHQNLNRRTYFTPLQADNGFWLLSDERSDENYINIVENEQVSLGFAINKNNLRLTADIYRKNIFNLWTSSFEFHYEEDPYQFSDMLAKGVELSAQYRYEKYFALVSYNRTFEQLNNEWGVDIPSPYSQPHRFQIFQSLQINRLKIASTWRFASGRFFSVPTDFMTESNSTGGTDYYTSFGDLLTQQNSSYHVLDFSLSYSIPFNRKRSLALIGMHITNAYNRPNIIKTQYGTNWKTDPPELGLLEERGLPFTPNISLDLVF